jgi:hypothetical protein
MSFKVKTSSNENPIVTAMERAWSWFMTGAVFGCLALLGVIHIIGLEIWRSPPANPPAQAVPNMPAGSPPAQHRPVPGSVVPKTEAK